MTRRRVALPSGVTLSVIPGRREEGHIFLAHRYDLAPVGRWTRPVVKGGSLTVETEFFAGFQFKASIMELGCSTIEHDGEWDVVEVSVNAKPLLPRSPR